MLQHGIITGDSGGNNRSEIVFEDGTKSIASLLEDYPPPQKNKHDLLAIL